MSGTKRAVEPEAKKQLGTELRRLRHETGLSLSDVARLLGVSKPYLGKAERGETLLSYRNIRRLAGIYDQQPSRFFVILGLPEFDWLARFSEGEPSGDTDLEKLTEDERRELVSYVGYLRYKRSEAGTRASSVP